MKTELTPGRRNTEAQRTQRSAEKEINRFLRVSPRPLRLCVSPLLAALLLCVLALIPSAGRAATNDLTALLQQGLFEEQANRNLDAAIASYQSLATQFDKDRQLAATAVFRLGECYRAQGKTNEAAAQYQRILRDFSNEQTLATLSRQNLTGMGMSGPSTAPTTSSAGIAQQKQLLGEEIKLVEEQLASQQAQVKAGAFSPDGVFTTQQKLFELRRQLAALDSNRPDLLSIMAANGEEQEIARIQQMIQNSPDLINARGEGGMPLSNAATKGWLKVATYLMDHGADVNGSYALSAAVNSGNRAIVELLLSRGADVGEMDNSNGRTLLQTAVQKGYQSVAEVLLANKADVNAQANSGDTALTTAVSVGQAKIVKMLLAAGANPNVENKKGRTSLSFAAERGPLEIVKLLLDAKADPNGGKLDAPLFSAIQKQDVASVELLLQAGANPNLTGDIIVLAIENTAGRRSGNRLSHVAPLWLATYWQQLPMVQLLLKYKADPNDSQTDGKPLLFSALSDTNILEALLDGGAKVDAIDLTEHFNHQTPLMAAIIPNNAAAVEILLKHGANPNALTDNGYTPLHYYAAGNLTAVADRKIFDLLFAHGADPNVRDNYGQTPLDILKQRLKPADPNSDSTKATFKEFADLLRQHGALDKLPDWDRITVSRPSANFSQAVFQKGTNDWNQFTLLETILNLYPKPVLPESLESLGITGSYQGNLPFPDFAQVVIVRHRSGTTNETHIKVNFLNSTNGIDCAKDMPLEFGDVVEIPERNHALGDRPLGLSANERASIADYLKGTVLLVTHGQKVELPIYPNAYGSQVRSVMQNSEAQKVLLSSSDLSRVKVTRRDVKTGKNHEWIVDCSGSQSPSPSSPEARVAQELQASHDAELNSAQPKNSQSSPDLWLRAGDVIEVPEKP